MVRPLPNQLPMGAPGSIDFDSPATVEVQLREYLRIFFKYRILIVGAMLVAAFLSLLYAFTATPLYTSESKIRISTYEPVLSATRIEDVLQEKSKESTYLETQFQEMKSYSLADKVLEDPKIREELFSPKGEAGFFQGLFGHGGGGMDKQTVPEGIERETNYKSSIAEMRQYLNAIEIRPVRRTNLVSIAATAQDPQVAALIANKHALTYIDWLRETRIEQQSRGLQFLRAQSEELREKVADLEREAADYAEANAIVAVNKDENITAQKMSQLNSLLSAATAKRIEAENKYKEGEEALSRPSAGFDDISIQTMSSQLASLEAEYQQLSAKFMPGYPRMQQLRSQIDGLKRSIETRRQEIVRGLKTLMLAAQKEEKDLAEELEQQKSQAFELSKRQVQYNVLNRELTSSRELLQNVIKQIKETSLAVESNASNVSVVDYAVVPRSPSFPRKGLTLLLGVLIGLAIGVGIALLLNYLDNTIRTPEDVAHMLRLPSLGVVPSFELEYAQSSSDSPSENSERRESATPVGFRSRVRRLGISDLEESDRGGSLADTSPVVSAANLPQIAFISNPRSLAAEAYRTIRTGILLSQAGEPPRTILVSSAQSSEGKTTSSINLAASLASAGGRVALVDCDLRRPSVHKHFSLESNEPGLVEVIAGHCSLDEALRPDIIKRVAFIPSGKIPPNPAELLGSLEMATILDQLAANFDYVVIDSPPVLPVTDSVILSRYVDGVVLVVRGAVTPRRVVNDAKLRLKSVGARLLGVVLNDVDVTGGDYYYYSRYYHSYYQEDRRGSRQAVG